MRLKYHNPAVPMTVEQIRQTQTASTEATLSIHFAPSADSPQTSDSVTSSPAPRSSTTTGTHPSSHDPTDRVETINMKERTNAEILQDFIRITRAHPVEPTQEDLEEMRELEEQKERNTRENKIHVQHRERRQKEKEIFESSRNLET